MNRKYHGIMPSFIHYRGVPQLFMESMVDCYRAGVFQHKYTQATSSRTNAARAENGRNFLASNAEWIFLVDTDMVFTPDIIINLKKNAQRLKAKAISGWALMPKDGLWPHAWRSHSDGYVPWGDVEPMSDPFKVDAVGGACFLVHRQVYQAIANRYAGKTEYLWQEETYNPKIDKNTGEDIVFSQRVTEAGFDIWYDPTSVFFHLKQQLFGPAEYQTFKTRLLRKIENAPTRLG